MLTESPLNGVRKIRSRVPAESTDTTQVLAAAARLPDGQGRVGALLRPVSVSAVAPGRRRECREARDGRTEAERSPTALRDHVLEATRGDPGPQGAPSSPTFCSATTSAPRSALTRTSGGCLPAIV